MGRLAGEAGDGAWLASRIGALKVGGLPLSAAARETTTQQGVPRADRSDGAREPALGLLLNSRELLKHAQTLVAADFFSVDTIFFKRLYVLIYVHLATRRVLLASCTAEPNAAWVTQQARNLNWKLEEEGIKLNVLIHDRV